MEISIEVEIEFIHFNSQNPSKMYSVMVSVFNMNEEYFRRGTLDDFVLWDLKDSENFAVS